MRSNLMRNSLLALVIASTACVDVRVLIKQLEQSTGSGVSIKMAGIDNTKALLTLARAVHELCEQKASAPPRQ